MALSTIDDESLAASLFEVFRFRGYEGTSISLLSEVTGLKKSSLYHRFPAGKEDMVKAVVLYVSSQLHEHILAPLFDTEKSPEQRFNSMLTSIKSFYHDGKKNCLLNILSLGDVKDEINQLLTKDYNDWLDALCKLGKDAGISSKEAQTRAEHFLISVQGALVIQRLTKNVQTFQNVLEYERTQFFRSIMEKPDQ